MKKICIRLSVHDQGLRLDQFIIKNLKVSISRARIQKLIKDKNILVNKKPNKAHYKVKQGDIVLLTIPEPHPPEVKPEKIPLDIVFEDKDILIINKPSGLVTHPAAGNYSHTLVNALLSYGCRLSAVNGRLRPGIVHRLDKDTSGLLVVAKNDFAHQHLAGQFRRHTIKRRYVALVKGKVEHNEGIIDLPISRDSRNRQQMTVSFQKHSKSALTKYKIIKRNNDFTLLQLSPYTGRTHQLRVHLKFFGHPILGDRRYGRADNFGRLALHAAVLGFQHPRTKKPVEFRSEIPACFRLNAN